MTHIKPRAIRALKDARTRMRDVAAAAHATAAAERDRAAQHLADEHTALDAALDGASHSLAAARNVHDLDRVAGETTAYRHAVAIASDRYTAQAAATELTADRLRERTRQLRTAEKIAELVDDYRAKRDATAEQRGSDDLAGRKTGRPQ